MLYLYKLSDPSCSEAAHSLFSLSHSLPCKFRTDLWAERRNSELKPLQRNGLFLNKLGYPSFKQDDEQTATTADITAHATDQLHGNFAVTSPKHTHFLGCTHGSFLYRFLFLPLLYVKTAKSGLCWFSLTEEQYRMSIFIPLPSLPPPWKLSSHVLCLITDGCN